MASACTPTTTGRQGHHRGGEGERLPCIASRRRHGASPQRRRGPTWPKDTGMGLQLRRVGQLGESDQVQGLREDGAPDHRRQSKSSFQESASGHTRANSATPSCRGQGLVLGNRAIQEAREGRISQQTGRRTRTRALGAAWAIAEPRARTVEEPARCPRQEPRRATVTLWSGKNGATNLQPRRRRRQQARRTERCKP